MIQPPDDSRQPRLGSHRPGLHYNDIAMEALSGSSCSALDASDGHWWLALTTGLDYCRSRSLSPEVCVITSIRKVQKGQILLNLSIHSSTEMNRWADQNPVP